jgi:hypothetical protein
MNALPDILMSVLFRGFDTGLNTPVCIALDLS